MAKVAVLLATYNGERYIEELLNSLNDQTMQDFHCYIHDDGSTDKTISIIQNWIKDKKNFELVEGKPTGSSASNFLFLLSKIIEEEYIMFCDQDDVWNNHKIETEIQFLVAKQNNPDIPVVVCTDLTVVSENLDVISDSFFQYENRDTTKKSFNDLLKKNIAPGCTMAINRKAAIYLLSYDQLCLMTMHDWAVMLIASLYGDIFVYNKSTILYRQHKDNVVGAQERTGIAGIKKQVREILSLKKIQYVKNSVNLEKNIIKLFLYNSDLSLTDRFDFKQAQYLFSRLKYQRFYAYLKLNGFELRYFVRALFV